MTEQERNASMDRALHTLHERPTSDDGWQDWGVVYDRHATVGVITALQSEGWKVRAVKEGNHNRLYVQKRS